MRQGFLERLREAIADRGRDLLAGRRTLDLRSPAHLCAELLGEGHGEASGVALAREIVRAYQGMDAPERLAFFEMIERDFGPDPGVIRAASARYLETHSVEDYLALSRAIEPRRQELFRRLNMAPRGTRALVGMRADLLGFLRSHPDLRTVDADLHHLLASWFNRGFLQLRRIDWNSPVALLEKLIVNDSVHEVRGFQDLRRRLARDRRCFALFHPVMPDEPLFFVEVALVCGIPRSVGSLLDPAAPLLDPETAETAVFFSNCSLQPGLAGISFGSFLVKQVVEELRMEFPGLARFTTLSPLPRLALHLRSALRGETGGLEPDLVEALLAEYSDPLGPAPGQALLDLLERDPVENREALTRPLLALGMAYLLGRGPRGLLDPEAAFHASNGACLEGLHAFADLSGRGLAGSLGLMASYLYVPEQLEQNHETFVETGELPVSRSLSRLRREVQSAAKTVRRRQRRNRTREMPAG